MTDDFVSDSGESSGLLSRESPPSPRDASPGESSPQDHRDHLAGHPATRSLPREKPSIRELVQFWQERADPDLGMTSKSCEMTSSVTLSPRLAAFHRYDSLESDLSDASSPGTPRRLPHLSLPGSLPHHRLAMIRDESFLSSSSPDSSPLPSPRERFPRKVKRRMRTRSQDVPFIRVTDLDADGHSSEPEFRRVIRHSLPGDSLLSPSISQRDLRRDLRQDLGSKESVETVEDEVIFDDVTALTPRSDACVLGGTQSPLVAAGRRLDTPCPFRGPFLSRRKQTTRPSRIKAWTEPDI